MAGHPFRPRCTAGTAQLSVILRDTKIFWEVDPNVSTGMDIDLALVSALVGVMLPVVTAVLTQDRLSSRANAVIVAVATMAAALGTVALRHDVTAGSLTGSFVIEYVAAAAFYQRLWQPTGIVRAIQTRTSPRRTDALPRLAPLPRIVPRPLLHSARRDLGRC